MNIILLGPPGSGKGTQSSYIKKRYNIYYVSFGEILRKILLKKDDFSFKINNFICSGTLVPDDIAIKVFNDYLDKKEIFSNNCLFDGFPRSLKQAQYLNFLEINYVIEFSLLYTKIIDRLLNRRIHLKSGRIYNLKYFPPKIDNLDDITGEELTIRSDDCIDIIKSRVFTYNLQLNKFRKFYKNYFLLKNKDRKNVNYGYYIINSDEDISIIKNKVFSILDRGYFL